MDDKNNKLSEEEMLNKIGNESVTQHLDAHLEENIASHEKKRLDRNTILTYIGMVVVIIACIIIVYVFLDKNDANPFTKTTTESTSEQVKTIMPTTNDHTQDLTVTTTTSFSGDSPTRPRDTTEVKSTTRTSYHTIKPR